ncbi:MAG: tetratricopeptide repeat protein [Mariprofundaceae bacterium]
MFGRALMAIVMACVFTSSAVAGNKGLMGALIGAGAGAAIGHSVDRTGGSGKGAAIGAIGGYIIGSQMDKSDERAQRAEEAQRTPPPAAQQQGAALNTRDCHNKKAQKYLDKAAKTKDSEKRVYLLEKATRLCPSDPRLHNDLGVAYYNRDGIHDRDRARDELREALRLDPGYTVARDNLNNI